MKRIVIITILMFGWINNYSQTDSTKLDDIIVKSNYLRFSSGYLNGYICDMGFGRQTNSLLISTEHEGFWYRGVYLSNELIFSKIGLIIGPKIGVEYAFQGGAMGGTLGLEIIRYSDFKGNNAVSITPKFDIPIMLSSLLIVSYGYNCLTNNIDGLAHHKIIISCNLNMKSYRLIKKGDKMWREKYCKK